MTFIDTQLQKVEVIEVDFKNQRVEVRVRDTRFTFGISRGGDNVYFVARAGRNVPTFLYKEARKKAIEGITEALIDNRVWSRYQNRLARDRTQLELI